MDIKIVVLAFALTVACASPMPKSSNQEIPMTQETVDRLNSIESGFKVINQTDGSQLAFLGSSLS